jgi:hypothetical protein
VAFGTQDGDATMNDPVVGDWPTIRALMARVNGSAAYADLPGRLNSNNLEITPLNSSACSIR